MENTEFKGTPGPWRWELNMSTKDLNLCGGKPKYDLIVMDFERWGMQSAQPRFNNVIGTGLNIMQPAKDFASIVEGREHHANWFKDINHPDAQLIAAAPDLLEALQEIFHNYLHEKEVVPGKTFQKINHALNKALGKN